MSASKTAEEGSAKEEAAESSAEGPRHRDEAQETTKEGASSSTAKPAADGNTGAVGGAAGGVSAESSTSAGSGAESLEDTFGSSASKEYTFGSSHSQQMASKGLDPAGVVSKEHSSVKGTLGVPESGFLAARPPSPSQSQSTSPRSQRARRGKGFLDEEEEDDGCGEFTFGTSAPIQLPDFSQMHKSPRQEVKSLRQAGHGEELSLAPVQEVERSAPDRPPLPRSPPPAIHRPPPPSGAQPPFVSPRNASPRTASPRLPGNWHPHMPQQGFYGQVPMQPPPQMYVYNSAAAAAAYSQAAQQQAVVQQAAQQAVVQQVAAQQVAAQQAQAAQVYAERQQTFDHTGCEGSYADSPAAQDLAEEDVEGAEENIQQVVGKEPPLSIRFAFWVESTCLELCTCTSLQARSILACICTVVLIIGAIVGVALVPNSSNYQGA